MPDPIIHASFRLMLPVGVQLVQWATHSELRFLRKDARTVLGWLEEVTNEFREQIDDLSQELVITPCTDCSGKGQKVGKSGQLEVCMECSGSGRKGFKVPGKGKTKSTQTKDPIMEIARQTEPAPNTLFTREQLDRALKSCSTDGAPIELEKLMAAMKESV